MKCESHRHLRVKESLFCQIRSTVPLFSSENVFFQFVNYQTSHIAKQYFFYPFAVCTIGFVHLGLVDLSSAGLCQYFSLSQVNFAGAMREADLFPML